MAVKILMMAKVFFKNILAGCGNHRTFFCFFEEAGTFRFRQERG
jgi:hypothetical protein